VTAVITRFGVLGVFLLMVPESACIPVPSELTLLFAGFAVHAGWMSLPLAVLAATAGNLVGSLIAYGVGATRLPARLPVVRGAITRWQQQLDRHGTRAVFVARVLPLARSFVSLPAGARGVPLGRFVALTTAGCALWATAFILAGMLAGGAWTAVSSTVARAALAAGMAILLLSLLGGGRHRPGG
jgi:membrane protein DedA with SNARE-associated domain